MEIHSDGRYEGFSNDGQRLFDELEKLLEQPNGLQQLFLEFGRRQVCDAILSEEQPENVSTVDEIQALLRGLIANRPNMVDRKFEFTLRVLPDENS